ncbi:MAG: pirin family protein [Desulfocapsaceae bacterium]|nr:pirin family protein [Desulfocapsaceae bacterium]
MIQKIPADQRHFTDMGWLQTYWLFSFSSYYDPENLRHGNLRVFNDDVVQPQKGFGTHPHEEMEIVTIVLKGEMEHRDTMGNVITMKKNDVQRMTAGTGLQHSEWNNGDQSVHFFQVWILPDKNGLVPSYDQKSFNPASWSNKLTLLAGCDGRDDAVTLNTDAYFYRANLDEGNHTEYSIGKNRNQFVYLIDGNAMLNGERLNSKDQARINGESNLTIEALDSTDLLLIDIPSN